MLVIFLFYSNQTIILKFRDFFTTCHPNMPFSFEKKNNEMSFLDVGISQENGKFVLTVYRKPTFSGVYAPFTKLFTFYKQIWYALYLIRQHLWICPLKSF